MDKTAAAAATPTGPGVNCANEKSKLTTCTFATEPCYSDEFLLDQVEERSIVVSATGFQPQKRC